jgi:UDP-glucose 4-epimerase
VSSAKENQRRAAVLGGGGFIGTAVCRELTSRGWAVSCISAPRVRTLAHNVADIGKESGHLSGTMTRLSMSFDGMDAVVNAAGIANPTGNDFQGLYGANALLPRLISDACQQVGITRFIHVSSATVQGNLNPLDEFPSYRAGTLYARTKVLAEQVLLASSIPGTTILRPTSVHGRDRATTNNLVRFARSPLSTVLAPGEAPTPQVLVDNVAAVAAFLCEVDPSPPPIVLQPWEGWTTSSFLHCISGRQPFQLPKTTGQAILRGTEALSRGTRYASYHRRLELLWRGQAQSTGWLSKVGYALPYGRSHWDHMIQSLIRRPPSQRSGVE